MYILATIAGANCKVGVKDKTTCTTCKKGYIVDSNKACLSKYYTELFCYVFIYLFTCIKHVDIQLCYQCDPYN